MVTINVFSDGINNNQLPITNTNGVFNKSEDGFNAKWSDTWYNEGSTSILIDTTAVAPGMPSPNQYAEFYLWMDNAWCTANNLSTDGVIRLYYKILAMPNAGFKTVIIGGKPWEEVGWYLNPNGDLTYGYGGGADETIAAGITAGSIFRIEAMLAADPQRTKFFISNNGNDITPNFTSTNGIGENYDGSLTPVFGVSRTPLVAGSVAAPGSSPSIGTKFYIDSVVIQNGWVGPVGTPPPPATQNMGWGITRV